MNLRSPHWEWLLVDVANIIAVAVLCVALTGIDPWRLTVPVVVVVGLRYREWARRRREWKETP